MEPRFVSPDHVRARAYPAAYLILILILIRGGLVLTRLWDLAWLGASNQMRQNTKEDEEEKRARQDRRPGRDRTSLS
jgi:hypothetical protein